MKLMLIVMAALAGLVLGMNINENERGQAVKYEDLRRGQYTVANVVSPIGNEIIVVDRNNKAYFIIGAPTTAVGALIIKQD